VTRILRYSLLLAACSGGESTTPSPTETADSAAADTGGTWRSALYPDDWEPGLTVDDHALHDLSFAGYRNGEASLPDPVPGVTEDVGDHGADPTGTEDSTSAFQAAIDAAGEAGGGTVAIGAGSYRLDGVLTVSHNGVVLTGSGPSTTELFFTLGEGMTDRSHMSFTGEVTTGDDLLLAQDAAPFDTVVHLDPTDAATLSVGDEVGLGWVITEDFVEDHGMSDIWEVSNGAWRPFFRRRVLGVSEDGMVTLDVPLRYAALTRDEASLRVETGHLQEVGVQDLAVSTAVDWDAAWSNDRSHAIGFSEVRDAWVRNVRSFASEVPGDDRDRHLQSGGVIVENSARVTVSDTVFEAAQNRGPGGNGYLFEVTRSGEVLFVDCTARAGRHNFIQNWDFGTSGVVFLRTVSSEGRAMDSQSETIATTGMSEFHHQLAMANLIDQSTADDGWQAINRWFYSSGAGHTATESIFWNIGGSGNLTSYQFGRGYVIGTEDIEVATEADDLAFSNGTLPSDWTEGQDQGALLEPASLYEDQLARRLQRGDTRW